MLNGEKIDVLIAHETPLIAAGLAAAFGARQEFRVAQPDDPRERRSVSIAVTDYKHGIGFLTSQWRGAYQVLILTDNESEVSIRRAVELGASGYLPLSSCVEAVVSAVQAIHNGGTAIAPGVMTKMSMSLRSEQLTRREIDVLRLLMHGLSDKAIAHRLQRSIGTVKSHLKSLRAKLDAMSRTEVVDIARRRGLVSEDDRDTSRACTCALHGSALRAGVNGGASPCS
jgi:DNA-binding NarL/FixJ family response regulator